MVKPNLLQGVVDGRLIDTHLGADLDQFVSRDLVTGHNGFKVAAKGKDAIALPRAEGCVECI